MIQKKYSPFTDSPSSERIKISNAIYQIRHFVLTSFPRERLCYRRFIVFLERLSSNMFNWSLFVACWNSINIFTFSIRGFRDSNFFCFRFAVVDSTFSNRLCNFLLDYPLTMPRRETLMVFRVSYLEQVPPLSLVLHFSLWITNVCHTRYLIKFQPLTLNERAHFSRIMTSRSTDF